MARKAKNSILGDGLKAKGFFRLQITEDGKVKGDTGWQKNQVTDMGVYQYLLCNLAASAGSKAVAFGMFGTGTAPGAAATTLDGEITDAAGTRCAVTASSVGSHSMQFNFTLSSGIFTAAHNIANVGLINHSSTATANTIFAGNTFASSALASNQAVNASYQIRIS